MKGCARIRGRPLPAVASERLRLPPAPVASRSRASTPGQRDGEALAAPCRSPTAYLPPQAAGGQRGPGGFPRPQAAPRCGGGECRRGTSCLRPAAEGSRAPRRPAGSAPTAAAAPWRYPRRPLCPAAPRERAPPASPPGLRACPARAPARRSM